MMRMRAHAALCCCLCAAISARCHDIVVYVFAATPYGLFSLAPARFRLLLLPVFCWRFCRCFFIIRLAFSLLLPIVLRRALQARLSGASKRGVYAHGSAAMLSFCCALVTPCCHAIFCCCYAMPLLMPPDVLPLLLSLRRGLAYC